MIEFENQSNKNFCGQDGIDLRWYLFTVNYV